MEVTLLQAPGDVVADVEPGTVSRVCSGNEPPRGYVFRWYCRWRARTAS